MNHKKHIAIVTGAAGGIGKVIAQMFADNGYVVVAVDITETEFGNSDIHFQKADLYLSSG